MPHALLHTDHRRVLGAVARSGVTGRQALVETLGWSKNTVATRLNELIAAGWIRETTPPRPQRGRPSVNYSIEPTAGHIFVISASQDHVAVALADAAGTIRSATSRPFPEDAPVTEILGTARAAQDQLLTESGLSRSDVLVVTVGIPGAVDSRGRTTLIRQTAVTGDLDLHGLSVEAFDAPVAIENDANLMVLGEQALRYPHVQDITYVKVGVGIGAGILTGARLIRGARGLAGEVGHIPIQRGGNERCFCGNHGCVNQFASLPAILRRTSADGPISARDAIELVTAGDPRATDALRQAGRDLGESLIGMLATTSPEVLVIGGALAAVGDHVAAGVRETIYARMLPSLTTHLIIRGSDRHEEAAIAGGVRRAYDTLFITP